MSSFRKRTQRQVIQGTRTSTQTGQVITSSGNPSLDLILGGGLSIGSICLIEEDKYVTHSKVLAKYFLAEGIVSQQSVFLGSLDDDPSELLRKLPKPLNDEEAEKEDNGPTADEQNGDDSMLPTKNGLRIAWRYNDLPLVVNAEQTSAKIGHHFNLMEHMEPLLLDYAETAIWSDAPQGINDGNADDEDEEEEEEEEEPQQQEQQQQEALTADESNKDIDMESGQSVMDFDTLKSEDQTKNMDCVPADTPTSPQSTATSPPSSTTATASPPSAPQAKDNRKIFENAKYLRLLNEIHPLLREDKFTTGALGQKGLCRVCITSLGSPLWYDEQFSRDILKFLTVLRAAVRNSVAVCFITMPMHLVAKIDETLVSKIRNLVDYSIELESFAGSERETNPAFKEYNGLFHLRKITALNTLNAYMPETSDLAFKLRRKKFVIEKFHLPPELQENNNDGSAEVVPTLSCGGGGPSADLVNSNPKAASLDF